MTARRDPGLDTLLELDGQLLVVDPEGRYWVRFRVQEVPASLEKPHGLDYALTLHGPDGERLVGFDNAHPVLGQRRVPRIMTTAWGSRDRMHIETPLRFSVTSGPLWMRFCRKGA